MISRKQFFSNGRWIEYSLAFLLLILLIYNGHYALTRGYYPQPFFYDPSDTFADWFNPAYWARNTGVYDVWNALYPPISFLFLRLLGLDYCYPKGRAFDVSVGLAVRSCDWLGIAAILSIYVLDVVLIVILLAGRLAARLYGRCAAAVTLLLLTFSPLHITLSQIIRSDMMACAFMLCVMLSAHRAIGTKGLRPFVPIALWLGLAVATKWPFVAAGCAGLGVGVARLIAAPRAARGQVLSVMCGFVGLSLAALLCISPYLLLDYQTVLANLAGEARPYHLGATGGGVLWNLHWYLTGPIWRALGPGGVLLALLGGWAIVDDQATRIILAPVLTGFVVILATQHLVWDRWALPVVVLLAILAGGGAARLVAHVPAAWARPAGMGLALIVALPLARAAQMAHHLRLHDTRQQATSWFARTAPAHSRVLIEHFAWDLSPAPFRIFFPLGEAGCVDAKAMLRRKVGYQTVDLLRKGRSNVDIGTLPRAKLAACHIDYAIVTQADRYFAEQRRFPAEASNYAHLIKNSTTLAIFRPVPGVIGGPVVRVLQIRHIPASAR